MLEVTIARDGLIYLLSVQDYLTSTVESETFVLTRDDLLILRNYCDLALNDELCGGNAQ